jgi:hypothetical protein
MNQKELMCKQILESLFSEHKFEKVRLTEFKNPETNRSLELDLYNSDLHLALEYNGPQHYYEMPFYHRNDDAFEKQKARDLVKENYCRIYEITLIEVPNLQKFEDIKNYIVKTLDCMNISYTSVEMETRNTKECSKCGEEKSCNDFHKDAYKKDGYKGVCKNCHNTRTKENKIKNEFSTSQKRIKTLTETIPTKKMLKIERIDNVDLYDLFSERYMKLIKNPENIDESNIEFLKSAPEIVLQEGIRRRYPPTNIIKVCENCVYIAETTNTYESIIEDKLNTYLIQKKGVLCTDINITKDKEYIFNHILIVTISENILLKKVEIDEFLGLLLGKSDPRRESEISLQLADDIDLCPYMRNIIDIISDCLHIPSEKGEYTIYFQGGYCTKITWNEFYGISHHKIRKIKKKICRYLVDTI